MKQYKFFLLPVAAMMLLASCLSGCSSKEEGEPEQSLEPDTASVVDSIVNRIKMFDGKHFWTYWGVHIYSSGYSYEDYREGIGGKDSVTIGDKVYQKISIRRCVYDGSSAVRRKARGAYESPMDYLEDTLTLLVRDEGGRVYALLSSYLELTDNKNPYLPNGRSDYIPYPMVGDDELLLYDFNVGVGEKYLCDDFTVEEVRSITTSDGVERRQLTLDNGLVLVEGIGCLNSQGMLFNYLNPKATWIGAGYLSVYSTYGLFEMDGTRIFSQTYEESLVAGQR